VTTYDIVRQAIDRNIDARPLMKSTDEREWKVDVLTARVTEALAAEGLVLAKQRQRESDDIAREARQLIFDLITRNLGRTHAVLAEEITDALQKDELLVRGRPTPIKPGGHRSLGNARVLHDGPASECQVCRELAKLPPLGRTSAGDYCPGREGSQKPHYYQAVTGMCMHCGQRKDKS